MAYKVGDKIKGLPVEYHEAVAEGKIPSECTGVMITDGAEQGKVAFIKAGVLRKVVDIDLLAEASPPEGTFDLVVMHPADVPDQAMESLLTEGYEPEQIRVLH